MAQMVATFRKILYFCTVKIYVRYIAAAMSSVFCITNLLVKYSRKEWVVSNAPKVSALENLTAPIAAFFIVKL
jgi:hypothetical protein